jgi:hypothetical protein
MKFKIKFDGVTDRKALAGFKVNDDDALKQTIWLRKKDFPDGLPTEFVVTLSPIKNAKKIKPPQKKAA